MRTIARVALLALPLAASCTTYTEALYVGSTDYEIASRTAFEDGVVESYLLDDGRYIRVKTRREQERPFLGFQVVEIDKSRALEVGVDPYSGMLVTDTFANSSARQAGVRPGDVLLTIDGQRIIYAEQLEKAEYAHAASEGVVCELLRGAEKLELSLKMQTLAEDVTDVESIALESGISSPRPYAGVTMRGIPQEWCERMFDDQKQAVVLSQVDVGSPAWLAGFRGGDILEQVDGEPCPSVAELSKRIRASGPAGGSMLWRVRRELGNSHEGVVQLADYSGTTRANFPLLWNSKNSAAEDRWAIGWGLVMSNRNQYVANQSTREVETRNRFSALLGLIQVDDRPEDTRVRLLWFITFET
ncbi:MAG: PDZ domain-containing protein [Planctomycetota bacterium]